MFNIVLKFERDFHFLLRHLWCPKARWMRKQQCIFVYFNTDCVVPNRHMVWKFLVYSNSFEMETDVLMSLAKFRCAVKGDVCDFPQDNSCICYLVLKRTRLSGSKLMMHQNSYICVYMLGSFLASHWVYCMIYRKVYSQFWSVSKLVLSLCLKKTIYGSFK